MPLPSYPDRLRLGEQRGIGPWDPAYFKREATLEELRLDLLERDAHCDRLASVLVHLDPAARDTRRRQMERVVGHPIENIERLLPVVHHNAIVFHLLVRLIDDLPCDDPRKSRYRRDVAQRVV